MARARNIKPGFFINEELVELPFSTRLLFIGLWTLADREGRLADKPKKIKMAVFPADDVDVNAGLDELQTSGFIIRYVVENERYIQIRNFDKHQTPHYKEAASSIPTLDKPEANPSPAVLIPDSLQSDSLNPKPEASTGNGPTSNGSKPLYKPKGPDAEVTVWLDAVAPLTGAKDRKGLLSPTRWRDTVGIAIRDGMDLPRFLKAVEQEYARPPDELRFVTPESCLKRARASKSQNGKFTHEI